MKSLATFALAAGLALSAAGSAAADDGRIVNVRFQSGATGTIMHDSITGYEYVLYRLNARNGQFLTVSLDTDSNYAGFNVYVPGKGPGDEALYNSDMGGALEYYGQLYMDGVHTVDVYLNRAGARQGRTAHYDIHFEISATDGSQSYSGSVSTAESECLAAVSNQLGVGDVSTLSVEMGENLTTVIVSVPSAEQPWACTWNFDGVQAVYYMGEG